VRKISGNKVVPLPSRERGVSVIPFHCVSGFPTQTSIFGLTLLYSSNDFVRKKSSGTCPPIERNQRSDEDLSRMALVVVLFILSNIESMSPSRRWRMSIFPERLAQIIYPVSVFIL
jgi:hypothetical protein